MANVWDPVNQRWTDPATGNYLVGGQGMSDGTWQGGTWTNPQGGTLGANGQWSNPAPSTQTGNGLATIASPSAPGNGNPSATNAMNQQVVYDAQGRQIDANRAVTAASAAVIPKSQAQLDAERNANNAGVNVLNATAATFPIQQQQIDAKGNVINQQQNYTVAQQGYIGQEQQANTAAIGDANAIVQARGNTADQTAVGQYNNSVADISDRYANAGVSQPVRVATASNQGGPLAPGVIGDVRTQEQRVTQDAQDRQTQRDLQLKGAALAVSLIGTNVDLATQAAARVGLTLDSAQLLVNEAKNQKGYADIAANNAGLDTKQAQQGVDLARIGAANASSDVQQAQLNYNIGNTPPFAGAVPVIDPVTGIATSWGTPAQADAAKQTYQKTLQQQANAQQLRQSGALGNFSQPELLDLIGNGILSDDAVRDELVMRYSQGRPGGLSPYEANLAIENYHRKHGYYDTTGGSAGGSDADAYSPNATLPSATGPGSKAYQDALATLQAKETTDREQLMRVGAY